MTNNFAFQTDWASPPGETISDILSENNLPLNEFTQRMDLTSSYTKKLLNGNEAITNEIAEKLVRSIEQVLDY